MKRIIIVALLFLTALPSFGITLPKDATTIIENNDVEELDYEELAVKESLCIAKVISIVSSSTDTLPSGAVQRSQQLLLRILTGKDKGKERISLNVIPSNPAYEIQGEVGRKYLVTKIEDLKTGEEDYFVVDYHREPYVWYLVGLFLLSLLLVGGVSGLRAILSLVLTILSVAFLLIPWVLKGQNPILGAVLISFIATAITMILVAGINTKSFAATVGTVFGVSISGVISSTVIFNAPLSGLASTEAMVLWGNQFYEINFRGLLAAGMIVSCLGAVMDVAISISSSIQEIKIANPKYSFNELLRSGMNVGRDIIGTMTNTLVLAYTGMALPLLILIGSESNPEKYLNLELVVSEVTAAISGSIGLIFAVPLTAVVMSLLVQNKEPKSKEI